MLSNYLSAQKIFLNKEIQIISYSNPENHFILVVNPLYLIIQGKNQVAK